MNKPAALSAALAAMFSLGVSAQQEAGRVDLPRRGDTPAASPLAAKTAGAEKDDQSMKGPTEITATKEATYDEKTRRAVFIGDVRVKDPQFTITCEKLTAFLKQESTSGSGGGNPAAKPSASPSAKDSSGGGGGLDRAIAEGTHENPVVIVQDKPASDGGQPQHNVGRAERAEYDAKTGNVTLIGWPQISQGINLQKATSKDTIMYMNREGKTMRAVGPTTTLIQEQTQTQGDGKTSQRQ